MRSGFGKAYFHLLQIKCKQIKANGQLIVFIDYTLVVWFADWKLYIYVCVCLYTVYKSKMSLKLSHLLWIEHDDVSRVLG